MKQIEIRPRALALLCAFSVLTGVAAAQRNPHAAPTQRPAAGDAASNTGAAPAPRPHWSPEQLEEAETRTAVDERNRSRMHPGNPLELVGVFSGDNDARAATPILKNGDGRPAQVDTDELRERALAMYADRSVILRAPPASQRTSHPAATPRAPGKHALEAPEPAPVAVWPWVLVAVGVVVAWFLARSHPTVRRAVAGDAVKPANSVRNSARGAQAPSAQVEDASGIVLVVPNSEKTAA